MRIVAISFVVVFSALSLAAASPASSAKSKRVARGAYLAIITGCSDCHSPKSGPAMMAPDMQRLMSGRPATTPAPGKPAVMGQISASGDLTAW